MTLYYQELKSPVGQLTLIASDKGLRSLGWYQAPSDQSQNIKKSATHPILVEAKSQLTEYLEHRRKKFDLPLEISGTPFQLSVWRALQTIPYGQTWSYGELAKKIKNPQAVRAVGGANNKNPIAIIIPCHRVIGANGQLVGFGGGLDVKAKLLELEQDTQLRLI